MSSQTDPATSAPSVAPVKKGADFVTAPTVAILVGCVLAAMGNSRGSALLTWQLPLGLLALSLVYAGFQALRARRTAGDR
jgi:hypothetical protein